MLRRMQVLVAIALAALAGVVGCGSDSSSPVAPEDNVPPAAVTALTADVHATNDPSVSLTWDPGSEPDLVGYRVYRTERADAIGSTKRGSARITRTPVEELTGTTFVDDNVSLGETYSYCVTAVDQAGNESGRAFATVLVASPLVSPQPDPDEDVNGRARHQERAITPATRGPALTGRSSCVPCRDRAAAIAA